MLKQSFLFNVLLMILITIGLLFLFFNSLNWLTNHGKQTKVPLLMGKKLEKAEQLLEDQGFRIQIDSTYNSERPPLEVLFQEPESGAMVKIGRTIFLTVNKVAPPSVEMPNLVNLSFRNAMLIMHSYHLEIGDTMYRPDVAAGAVLEQLVKGKPILPGTMVPFGTRIDLVVGEGLSGELDVPNLIGMSWVDVQVLLDSLSLTANTIWEGPITDTPSAIVYMQEPESLNELDFQNSIPKGDIIDVHLMQNPSQEILDEHQPGSKKLIGDEGDSIARDGLPNRPQADKKVKEDSIAKPKLVKGMNIHLPPKNDKEQKNKPAPDTKGDKTPVKAPESKTKTPDAKPKVPAKTLPAKPAPAKTPDNISNDYN